MALLAILLDFIAAGNLYFVSQTASKGPVLLAIAVQVILVIILIALVVKYNGKRQTWIGPEGIGPQVTIRFSLIIVSMLANAAFLVMLVMRVLSKN